MKEITISQEHTPQIILEDEDESDIEEYVRNISSLLESNYVANLHLSSGSVVLRPNKITSIIVKNIPTTTDLPTLQTSEEVEVEKPEESEDIITD